MATNICRLCGNLSTNNIDIFRTNGLKHKIETCLPITLYQPCLLPDTICTHCLDNVDSFFSFIKHCIQNILILESQYDIADSCLRSKRKHDRGCSATISDVVEEQPDVYDNITRYKERSEAFQRLLDGSERLLNQSSQQVQLVDYEDSDRDEDYILDLREDVDYSSFGVVRGVKRKMCDILPVNDRTKIFKFCTNRRRKNTQPKRLVELTNNIDEEFNRNQADDGVILPVNLVSLQQRFGNSNSQSTDILEYNIGVDPECDSQEDVVCLLCDAQFTGSDFLAKHVLQTHGIDMARIISSEPVPEMQQYQQQAVLTAEIIEEHDSKLRQQMSCLQDHQNEDIKPIRYSKTMNGRSRRKSELLKSSSNNIVPNCLLKQAIENLPLDQLSMTKALSPFTCQLCPAALPNRTDLFTHLRLKHSDRAPLICGLCFSPNINTFYDLHSHLDQCKTHYQITQRYYCKVCYYSDDSTKMMEIHIAVHDFLIGYCKEERKLFDPEEYIEHNPNCDTNEKFRCDDCLDIELFPTLSDYVAHKRSAHDIFMCDLCNKSYGRSSHLWKHVHRLHKSHPTITCPICEKTSASKYHLTQHFIKAHTKPIKTSTSDDFLNKKFAAFDFQSVRQSFMRQELIQSDSNFQCTKCMKSFGKRSMLKKHRALCRHRPQKDLLTRCASCARIFKDRQSLAKHLLNYHSEYTCEVCSDIVISKCEIVSHIRFNHPNCKLFCNQCGEILRSQADLNDHLLDHDNSNVCQFCGDLLNSKIKLKMHILSLHRHILSLSCGVCLKLFDNQHVLRDHVQLNHKNALNPLTSCTICGKNYGSKWKAYDHLNKSHGRIFHACKNCLAVFDEPVELTQHSQLGLCFASKNKDRCKSVVNGNNNDVEDSELEDNKSSCTDDDLDDLVVKREPQSDDGSGDCEHAHEVGGKGDVDYMKKKMCLLEKRLLGEKIAVEDGMGREMENADEVMKASSSPPPPPPEASHPPPTSFIPIPISATAKRTVYVNALAPACCDICSKTWPAKKHLWQHYIRCHKQEAATVCGICLCTNRGSYKVLARHLVDAHPDLLYGKGFGSNFICRVCGRYHNARSKLRMHMAIHTGYIADKGKPNASRNSNIKKKQEEDDDDDEDDDNDDDDDEQPTPIENTLSTSTDSSTDTSNVNGTADIDSSTSTSPDDARSPSNSTNANVITSTAAQIELSNAVDSINAQLTTLDDNSACADVEEEIITMDDTDPDMVAMLPQMTLLDTDGHLLSHELQNAVDSIL